MKTLLLLDGMTGAGKTTATVLLKQKLPRTAIIGMDKVKWYISDFERGARDNDIARQIVFAMAEKYLELGLSVIVDQPLKDDEVRRYETLANERSARILKFQLWVEPEVAFSRVTSRQKDKENKVPEERIRRNISLFRDASALGFTLIDTTKMSEGEAAEIILRGMEVDTPQT